MDKLNLNIENDIQLLIHITVITIIFLCIYFTLNMSINRFIKKHQIENEKFDATNYNFLQRFINIVVFLVGFSFIIFLIPSLKHIATTILAGAGVMVAVIGFASQQVLSNILSGIMIVATKPYRVNDRVSLRNITGVIEDITLRHTIIKNYENKRYVIPNSIMNNEIILNSNFKEDICCEFVEMNISFTSNVRKAKEIMKNAIISHPLFIDFRDKKQVDKNDDIVPVRVVTIGEYAITLRAWTWAASPGDAFILGCDLNEIIKEQFEIEGVEIAYPYSNVILKK